MILASVAMLAVAFGPNSAAVQSDKDLSNVVIRDCLGNEYKIENPSTNMFTDEDGIVTIWVKAGNNHSGDGPGYGQRFDNEEVECQTPPTTVSSTTTTTQTTIPQTPTPTTTTTLGSPDPDVPTVTSTTTGSNSGASPSTTTTSTTPSTPTTLENPPSSAPSPDSVKFYGDELPHTGANRTLAWAGWWLLMSGAVSIILARLLKERL